MLQRQRLLPMQKFSPSVSSASIGQRGILLSAYHLRSGQHRGWLIVPISIVFIHGLSGHRERTWTASGEPEPWPKTLLPSKLPNARILTFGYNAYVTSWQGVVSQDRLGSHAGNLLNSLASYREDDNTVGTRL